MADSANAFKNFLPDMKNVYGQKIQKAAEKPNNKRYFSLIKKKLKEAKRK